MYPWEEAWRLSECRRAKTEIYLNCSMSNTDLKAVKKCFVYSLSFWYSSVIAADNRRRADSFRLSSNLWSGASTWVMGYYWIQLWDSLIENASKHKWCSVCAVCAGLGKSCNSLCLFCKLQQMGGWYSDQKKMGAYYESSQELQVTLNMGMRRLQDWPSF